jgi:alkanesulfonate monooxygenase SsuD/methylene tetrahydromethanopterin reductase-like flavin-dependent oxidoreductase (luciferase family)
LNISRSKQGEPLIFQAGSSENGRAFAAGNAEAIFTHSSSLEETKAFYDDVKKRAQAAGKNPDHVKIYPGINPLVADSLEEAEAKYQEFASLIPIENAVRYLARYFDDYDFSSYDLDASFPELGDIGKNAFRSTTDYIKQRAKENNQTLRQVALEQAVPRPNFIGTPTDVADEIQRWFEAEAIDGFIIGSDIPGSFERFINEVIPILQERGIYRKAYAGSTLRENIGVPIVK